MTAIHPPACDSCRMAARFAAEAGGAVPDAVPLARALLAEQLRARHTDGICRPFIVKGAYAWRGDHGIGGSVYSPPQ